MRFGARAMLMPINKGQQRMPRRHSLEAKPFAIYERIVAGLEWLGIDIEPGETPPAPPNWNEGSLA